MSETGPTMTSRQGARRPGRTTSQASPSQDGLSRRMIEPLDESGAPVTPEPQARGAGGDNHLLERIRIRAYERYLERQGRPGSPESDWIEAEREVRSTVWSSRDRGAGSEAI